MTVSFVVYGEPQGKARARTVQRDGKTHTHTPENTVMYENLIKMEYRAQCGKRYSDDAQLVMAVTAYMGIPKSRPKSWKIRAACGEIRPIKRPDGDNILKVVADALNDVAYREDSQIVDASISKRYTDEQPRVVVYISETT